MSSFQLSCDELSVKAASLEFEKDKLTNQMSSLESAFELFKEQIEAIQDEQARVLSDKVAEVDARLMEMALQVDGEFYPGFLTNIAGWRWLLTYGLKLVVIKCLQSPKYLSVLGKAIGKAVNKGMQDGLAAGIEHGKSGLVLSDVTAYNPSTDTDYIVAVSTLCDVDFPLLTLLSSQKDASIADIMDSLRLEGPAAATPEAEELKPSHEQLMLPIHRPEDNVDLKETSLSFSLEVAHNRVHRVRGDAKARRISLFNS